MLKLIQVLALTMVVATMAHAQNANDDYLETMRQKYKARGITLTPAQEQQLMLQAKMLEALSGRAVPGSTAPNVAQAPPSLMSDDDLAKKVNGLRQPGTFFEIESRKDGFVVNGRAYVDPVGRISKYAIDPFTGDAAYLAETSPGQGKLKWVSLSSPDDSIEFGNASYANGVWNVSTVTGKVANGDLLVLIPSGVLIGRDSAVFRYEPGKRMKSVALPKGYFLAPLQHGTVGSTETVLLEKEKTEDQSNPLSGIGKLIGRIAGAKFEDYAFLNLSTGNLIPLNVSADGKTTNRYSECRKKNNMVNVCNKMTSFESLYDQNGLHNMTHYYWRTNWHKTKTGAYAVVQENGLKEINIIDLATGKRVNAFERGLGIESYSSGITKDGKLRIVASWAFGNHVIDDVEATLASSAPSVVGQDGQAAMQQQ